MLGHNQGHVQKCPFQQRAVEAQRCHATWNVYAYPWTLPELLGHPKEERDSEEKTSIWNSEEKTYTAKMTVGGGGGFVLFCFVFKKLYML